ncbi:UDP-N-acetylglucosamine 1-carboxyvinyltransferase [Anaerofustis sp.]|uniref:UDP-N-acetylglucosamine 1-carboxyvinyltransferase n=1 Tax=Anaerofustis sp. TaxID=1872517 RepID=UPI0025B7C4BD|nr:UDP-N-acetylglucosamine 1-carboxyvinyltransferase [Anaerofustis sp.]
MGSYMIEGGRKLSGEIQLQGCKNAALPILAASVLNKSENIIHNVPDIKDVDIMLKMLRDLGCKVEKKGNTVIVDSQNINKVSLNEELLRKMRSSIILMGAVLSLRRECSFSMPGGCDIGLRPIDLHIKALKEFGCSVSEENGIINIKGEKLKGRNIQLDFPSVGVTENIILASVLADGVTAIGNPAKEPEIIDLQNFLNGMGARVYGAGGNTVYIEGVKKLNRSEYTIMGDRIVCGTFMCLANITGSDFFIRDAKLDDIKAVYYKLSESGEKFKMYADGIHVQGAERVKSVNSLITLPYPGFPTDMQSQMSAMLSVADGVSIVSETIFENRYKYTCELNRMGANMRVSGKTLVINGVKELSPAQMYAQDLRGGASLVIAALAAEGKSFVHDIYHIERGYEDFDKRIRSLGGSIKKID